MADVGALRARLERLRLARAEAGGRLHALEAERRDVLAQLLNAGVPQAEVARWEGVTSWAVAQAARKSAVAAGIPDNGGGGP